MNLKRLHLPTPIEPLAQNWTGISTESNSEGLVQTVFVDLDVYEPETSVRLDASGFVRVIAHNRRGPHFDVGRSYDGLRGYEGHKMWTREIQGGPLTWHHP